MGIIFPLDIPEPHGIASHSFKILAIFCESAWLDPQVDAGVHCNNLLAQIVGLIADINDLWLDEPVREVQARQCHADPCKGLCSHLRNVVEDANQCWLKIGKFGWYSGKDQ